MELHPELYDSPTWPWREKSEMGKVVVVHRFPESLVKGWLELLCGRDIGELYAPVLKPQSSASQLKAVKKVRLLILRAHVQQ